MPQRTREHQLEDISRARFKSLIPPFWVCRDKPDNDYGVDQEVELFDENGQSTGLVFNVQLKATDDNSRKQIVSMRVDSLRYLASLDTPSIIARYSASSNTLYWMWITNAVLQIADPGQKTVTLTFSEADLWTEESSSAINTTLGVFRIIKIASRSLPVGLLIANDRPRSAGLFPIDRAIAKLADETTIFRISKSDRPCLPVTLRYSKERLTLAVDCICSLSFEIEELEYRDILSRIAYGLAFMADRYDFAAQARNLAGFIRRNKLAIDNRYIAAAVALSMSENAADAVEIAKINGLHEVQDPAFVAFVGGMIDQEARRTPKSAAVQEFYELAILAHSDAGGTPLAVIHYSLANYQSSMREHAKAICNFNLARKHEPDYLDRDYFLCELGGLLFLSGHYAASAKWYERALLKAPSARTQMCYGDALLYSGFVGSAEKAYSVACSVGDHEFAAEARLKKWVSEWLSNHLSAEDGNIVATLTHIEHWQAIVATSFQSAQFDDALAGALIVSFLLENENSAWEIATIAAAMTESVERLLDVISSSIHRTGYDAYSGFRQRIATLVDDEEWLQALDDAVENLHRDRDKVRMPAVTFRSFRDFHFDVAVEPE